MELISESPLPQTLDSMFHSHTCESDEYVYFKLKRNLITQLPATYLILLAPTKNGIISKLLGSNQKDSTATSGKKFRPFFNDALFGWETLNSSQLFLHYYNKRVRNWMKVHEVVSY